MFEMVVWTCLVCGPPLLWAVILQAGDALVRRPAPVERWDLPLGG